MKIHLADMKVRRRLIALCCFAVCCLIICWRVTEKDHLGKSPCLTGERFLTDLAAFKKSSDDLQSSFLQHTSSSSLNSSHKLLLSSVTVYYVWCQSQYFEFRNFLSVKSAIQNLNPSNVIIYYRYYPYIDSKLYNTWLSELQQDFPFLETIEATSESCYHGKPSKSFIYQLANERGGIYLGENTLITQPLPVKRQATSFVFGEKSGDIDLLIIKPKLLCEADLTMVYNKSTVLDCKRVSGLDSSSDLPSCIVLDKTYFPKDIWNLETAFGRFARKLFYGSSELPVLNPSYDELVPNIGHMIWFGGGQMDFLFFLGVLSLLHVAGVDTVYIHGDKPPSGYYWSLLEDNPRVIHVPNYGIHMVYGQTVKSYNHKSDVLRADLMYRYGGIYLDVDAVFVRKLDRDIRSYDAVASYDWIDWDLPFPDTINFGVTTGKKGADFWRLFRESMKWFIDDDFSWNGLRRPYQVMERHPNLIRIDPHLQVFCYLLKCHTTWWENYRDADVHHGNRKLDWRKDAYVFHFTTPTPVEFSGYDKLLKSDGMFADIGRYILNRSGLTDHFTKKMSMANNRYRHRTTVV